jgi:hypothetical protein
MFSVVLPMVWRVDAQSQFVVGEVERVHDLLSALGCTTNVRCALFDFSPTGSTACDYKPAFMKCDATGRLAHL